MSWLDTLAEIRNTDWSNVPEPDRDDKAREVIMISSMAGAASSAVPVPLVDLALLLPIHTVMVMTVGKVYGRELSSTEAKRMALELGAIAGVTLAGHAALSILKKLIPGMGVVTAVASAASGFAITFGFGQLAVAYFKNPSLSRDDLGKIFKDAMAEGAKIFSPDALDRFRQEDAEDAEDPAEVVEERAAEKSSPSEPSEPDDTKRETLRPKKRSL